MADDKKRPIIVKKVIEEGGHGHHGGAWKVAYADFVTAMMAFFLLLWILASSEEEELKGLADYFTPTMNESAVSGGRGPLGGETIGPPGTLNSSNSPMGTVAIPKFGQQDPMGETSAGEAPEVVVEYEDAPSEEAENLMGEVEEALREKDRQSFSELQEEIVQAMNQSPELKPLIPNVIFDKTDEGLRIQILDQEGRSMFASGSADVNDRTEALLGLIGQAVENLPNDLIISGHTDAVPFANDGSNDNYGNWELSADRANATRRKFLDTGIDPSRISRVSGLAATEPFNPEDPRAPENRRISVVLEYAEAPKAADIQEALDGNEEDSGNEAALDEGAEAETPAPAAVEADGPEGETIDLEGLQEMRGATE